MKPKTPPMVAPQLNKGKAMPRVWKLLVPRYILIFLLCSACLLVLFVACKMHDMAALFSSTNSMRALWHFAGWQMLALSPFALSLSAAISSYQLFSDLRTSHALCALRAAGFSLFRLSKPLISLTLSLCLVNAFIVSEVSTKARFKAKQLAYEFALKTPLISIYRQLENTPESKAFAKESLKSFSSQEKLDDFWLFTTSKKEKSLQIMRADTWRLSGEGLIGENVDTLTYIPTKKSPNGEESFDSIVLESSQTAVTNLAPIKEVLFPEKRGSRLNALRLKELLASQSSFEEKAYEALRRLCFAFAPLTLFLLAMASCLSSSRAGVSLLQKGLFLLSFTLFFVGLVLSKSSGFALMALFAHIQALFLTFVCLRRYERGRL